MPDSQGSTIAAKEGRVYLGACTSQRAQLSASATMESISSTAQVDCITASWAQRPPISDNSCRLFRGLCPAGRMSNWPQSVRSEN